MHRLCILFGVLVAVAACAPSEHTLPDSGHKEAAAGQVDDLSVTQRNLSGLFWCMDEVRDARKHELPPPIGFLRMLPEQVFQCSYRKGVPITLHGKPLKFNGYPVHTGHGFMLAQYNKDADELLTRNNIELAIAEGLRRTHRGSLKVEVFEEARYFPRYSKPAKTFIIRISYRVLLTYVIKDCDVFALSIFPFGYKGQRLRLYAWAMGKCLKPSDVVTSMRDAIGLITPPNKKVARK